MNVRSTLGACAANPDLGDKIEAWVDGIGTLQTTIAEPI